MQSDPEMALFYKFANAPINYFPFPHLFIQDIFPQDYYDRLQAAIPCAAQCTYDFREIRKLVPGTAYNITEIRRLFGVRESQRWDEIPMDDRFDALLRDASPITHLTRDDCPLFLRYNDDPKLVGDIHDPAFGWHIKRAMDKIGLECTLRMSSDYANNASPTFEQESTAFLKHVFRME